MEYRSVADLRGIADVTPVVTKLTRAQKIDIWVEALKRDAMRELHPLQDIEWVAPEHRALLRADSSPLTVAFDEPALRAAGLQSDRLGDAMAFFGLSEAQAHDMLCACRYGRSMLAGVAARRISRLSRGGVIGRLRGFFSHRFASVTIG